MKSTAGSPKPARAWVEVEHAGRPQRERDADRYDRDRQVVPDEHDDGHREDDEADGGIAHRIIVLVQLPSAKAAYFICTMARPEGAVREKERSA